MAQKLGHAIVRDGPRQVIHAVRVLGAVPELQEIDEIVAKMRERLLARYGEQFANVVVVIGDSRETLRLFGEPYATARIRAAMFHAQINWQAIVLP